MGAPTVGGKDGDQMVKTPEDILALRIGGTCIGDNIRSALKSGEVIEDKFGSLRLESNKRPTLDWINVPNGPTLGCDFWKHFIFRYAYSKSAVPHGCKECYKVKVEPRTLRELVAGWEVAKHIECRSKWGIDFFNPFSSSVYAGFFFVPGLEAARITFKVVRDVFNSEPKLGPDIPITIKRGCSEYEALLGPSDRYQFTDEMAEVEAYLKSRFRRPEAGKKMNIGMALSHWIDFAYRMGDETYLDFTDGQRLHPKPVSYEP